MPSREIQVIGAGPAGSMAAISAAREGASVTVFEKSVFPRHKVCGEFLSPEASLLFDRLGIMDGFRENKPHCIGEANIHIGAASKRWKLEEPAFGISRFALDQFLLERAKLAGAHVMREAAHPGDTPVIVASGRQNRAPSGNRLFGFKAHFAGPLTDRIDLLFEKDLYIGINSIESGLTNVCGLASERVLRQHEFQPDRLLAAAPRLSERLHPLTRSMEWLITGPLIYGGRFDAETPPHTYLAGDALGFVDPFTGSGMLGAMSTGYLAGRACALGISKDRYLLQCRRLLASQYRASGFFRQLIQWNVADKLAWLVPGRRIFDLTRPALAKALTGVDW